MKILFVGVFDSSKRSTNTSQLLCLNRLGHQVVGYNYRQRAVLTGRNNRDADLWKNIKTKNFDLVIFSKCNTVSDAVFRKAKEVTKTCLWFMDPLVSYDAEMKRKTKLVSYFCCDKKNVLEEALKINKNSFYVCEGYDGDVDKPFELPKEYDVSFIGNVYGDRKKMLSGVNHDIKVINNVFGVDHAKTVSKSRINLNFCTDNGASDRVYKIMAAGGFLLSNDWEGRKDSFTNGRDLVIFKDVDDLNNKIEFYLKNPELANMISRYGHETVKAYSRISWASKIVELSYGV